ncbi:hypothetical protein ACOME3_003775 [Neoechinorhynchus agilis]
MEIMGPHYIQHSKWIRNWIKHTTACHEPCLLTCKLTPDPISNGNKYSQQPYFSPSLVSSLSSIHCVPFSYRNCLLGFVLASQDENASRLLRVLCNFFMSSPDPKRTSSSIMVLKSQSLRAVSANTTIL